jgi:hypothetical protein
MPTTEREDDMLHALSYAGAGLALFESKSAAEDIAEFRRNWGWGSAIAYALIAEPVRATMRLHADTILFAVAVATSRDPATQAAPHVAALSAGSVMSFLPPGAAYVVSWLLWDWMTE